MMLLVRCSWADAWADGVARARADHGYNVWVVDDGTVVHLGTDAHTAWHITHMMYVTATTTTTTTTTCFQPYPHYLDPFSSASPCCGWCRLSTCCVPGQRSRTGRCTPVPTNSTQMRYRHTYRTMCSILEANAKLDQASSVSSCT